DVYKRQMFDLVDVNSWHHQALERVAASLKVMARAEDGIIEMVVRPAARFCVGVQFHPERMGNGAELFRRLVEAAQAPAAAR
ncbi:MAG: gamma-glutamyl-gamma-aminobutyrate hydrolase family protein, partial [Verrucomicrobiae bacterium]|nr:gamma-glutamyl-gamma-aminobutyrate hydrolase family protein [Verrucomicrobiae bacterium]